jgi:hypothetical protein
VQDGKPGMIFAVDISSAQSSIASFSTAKVSGGARTLSAFHHSSGRCRKSTGATQGSIHDMRAQPSPMAPLCVLGAIASI